MKNAKQTAVAEDTVAVGYADVCNALHVAAELHEQGVCSFLQYEAIAEDWLRGLWEHVENRSRWTIQEAA